MSTLILNGLIQTYLSYRVSKIVLVLGCLEVGMAREFYNLYSDDDYSVFEDHKKNCACCGGQTKEISSEIGGANGEVYRCTVCEMRIKTVSDTIEVLADPDRVRSILEDKYPQYDWGFTTKR